METDMSQLFDKSGNLLYTISFYIKDVLKITPVQKRYVHMSQFEQDEKFMGTDFDNNLNITAVEILCGFGVDYLSQSDIDLAKEFNVNKIIKTNGYKSRIYEIE
jgi:hypothetical protein